MSVMKRILWRFKKRELRRGCGDNDFTTWRGIKMNKQQILFIIVFGAMFFGALLFIFASVGAA